MTRRVAILSLAALLTFLAAGRLHAETTPDAQAWLEKMVSFYDRGPFSVTYSADMSVAQQDQTMSMDMQGEMTHSDPRHMRMDFSMDMTMPGAGDSTTLQMKMLMVIDGETVWMDMDNPMMGGRRVMKMSYDQAEQSSGNMGLENLRNMDPVNQMKEMMDKFDFQVVKEGGGEVVLSAPLDPDALARLGQMGQMAQGQTMEGWEMVLVLEAETAVPKEVRMGPTEEPVMTMRFSDWKFYGPEGLPAGTFDYTPPDGVQVMDLGAMQGGAQGGGS